MKVKPFYIRITDGMTPQIIQDAIDKCVDAGAVAEECVKNVSMKHRYYTENHIDTWDSFGVNIKGETFFWDVGNGTDNGKFGGIQNEITLDQLDEWLGLDKTETPEEKEAFDGMAQREISQPRLSDVDSVFSFSYGERRFILRGIDTDHPQLEVVRHETPQQREERERLENGRALFELVQCIWSDVDDRYEAHPYDSPVVDDVTKEMYARLASELNYRKAK